MKKLLILPVLFFGLANARLRNTPKPTSVTTVQVTPNTTLSMQGAGTGRDLNGSATLTRPSNGGSISGGVYGGSAGRGVFFNVSKKYKAITGDMILEELGLLD
jgi:hypothetical protein